MSLWPFSSSTSNIALGRAWVTVASIAIASSFWSSGATTVGRARAGLRPRELGREDLAKLDRSLPDPLFWAGQVPGDVGERLEADPAPERLARRQLLVRQPAHLVAEEGE